MPPRARQAPRWPRCSRAASAGRTGTSDRHEAGGEPPPAGGSDPAGLAGARALTARPKILSGGNPQVPKGYGDEAVEAYLAAVPKTGPGGWKHATCRRIDAIVSEQVPGVCKAVKWNSPFYGRNDPAQKDCWFLSFHCFDRYVKVTFFQGARLAPPPAETSKYPAVRYHHVREGEELSETFAAWARQASELPGEKL